MSAIINGELTYTHALPRELMVMSVTGVHDLTFGFPYWEYDRAARAHAWIYKFALNMKALDAPDVLAAKNRDEALMWTQLGVRDLVELREMLGAGHAHLPDALTVPLKQVVRFDCRDVIASREGIEVLCDLLKDPVEAQRHAAAEALRNLADPAVQGGMERIVSVLTHENADGDSRILAMYDVFRAARLPATFEAIGGLATNVLCWDPPKGTSGISPKVRKALILHMVKPHAEKGVNEGRAPLLVSQLMMVTEKRENIEHMAADEVKAIDTFFIFLASENTLTVFRTLQLLTKLVTKSTYELRFKWSDTMCHKDHFQRLMQMVMRSTDRRIALAYRTLLNFVLKQCDQQRLMDTVTNLREDDIKVEEQLFIAKILYGCLSAVEPERMTRDPIEAPGLKDARANRTRGLGKIRKLEIAGAPSVFVFAVPCEGRYKGTSTQMARIDLKDPATHKEFAAQKGLGLKPKNPSEIFIWVARTESELIRAPEKRTSAILLVAHTKPLILSTGDAQLQEEEEYAQRYEGFNNEPKELMHLEFSNRVFFQIQHVAGSDVKQYLQTEDPDLLQEEPPKVHFKLVTDGMVMKEMTEEKARANSAAAFHKGSKKQGVVDYILLHIEQIEKRCLDELYGEGSAKQQDDAIGGDEEEVDPSVVRNQDPAGMVRFTKDLLRFVKNAKATGQGVETLGDGSAMGNGQDIDAPTSTKVDGQRQLTMAYVRLNEQLRPIQRYLSLCITTLTQYNTAKMLEFRMRLIDLLESLDPHTSQCISAAVMEIMSFAKGSSTLSKDHVQRILGAMTYSFESPPTAERSLYMFTTLLTKYLHPDWRPNEDENWSISAWIVRPLLELLQKTDTNKEQKSFVFNTIRQGMRYGIIAVDSFTSSGKGRSKSKGTNQLHQVLMPMVEALENVKTQKNATEVYFEMSLCFNAASVLKCICITTKPEEHAQLVQLDVVPKLMKVLGEIRDFLPQLASSGNFEYSPPSFIFNSQTQVMNNTMFRVLKYVANIRVYRELCGAISNCCQCLSKLMTDTIPSTNCIPTIQFLAYDDGDGLRDLYHMLADAEAAMREMGLEAQPLKLFFVCLAFCFWRIIMCLSFAGRKRTSAVFAESSCQRCALRGSSVTDFLASQIEKVGN